MKGALVSSAVAAVLALAACAGHVPPAAGPPPDSHRQYAALEAQAALEIRRAAAQGSLWLHTEAYLAQARQAHAAGDLGKATRLAQKALQQALLAQKQAADNANAKADFTFRQ